MPTDERDIVFSSLAPPDARSQSNNDADNFWRVLNVSYGFLPMALRALYSHVYRQKYPDRRGWTEALNTTRPPGFKPSAPSLPASIDVNSTLFRYYEEFSSLNSQNSSAFKFKQNQDRFLNGQLEKFDVTFLCALLLDSSVSETLVSLYTFPI